MTKVGIITDIYIKPPKKVSLKKITKLTIKDITDVLAPKNIAENIEKTKVMDINTNEKKSILVSVTDLVKLIMKAYPDASVVNLGEMDTLVLYSPDDKKENPFFKYAKVAVVCLILFAGGSTAIMSFHTDAQIPRVLEKYYEIFFGTITTKPLIVDIPYSVGLAVGIFVFFNHFFTKKLTDDPTPIQVETNSYDTDVTDTIINILEKEQKQGG